MTAKRKCSDCWNSTGYSVSETITGLFGTEFDGPIICAACATEYRARREGWQYWDKMDPIADGYLKSETMLSEILDGNVLEEHDFSTETRSIVKIKHVTDRGGGVVWSLERIENGPEDWVSHVWQFDHDFGRDEAFAFLNKYDLRGTKTF